MLCKFLDNLSTETLGDFSNGKVCRLDNFPDDEETALKQQVQNSNVAAMQKAILIYRATFCNFSL